MRFEFLNQFYPPDVAPTGRFLHDVTTALAARGHEVRVLASRARYAPTAGALPGHETRDGVAVRRAGGLAYERRGHLRRGLSAAAFFGRAALTLSEATRPDLVVALTSPPFLGLAAARRARRCGARLAHWVMDVYPDALGAAGLLRPRGPAEALLRRLARRAHAPAALVISLGPRMAARLRPLVPATARLESVPLWGEEPPRSADADAATLRRERGWGQDELVLLYSGNMGLGHRLGEFLEAARRLGPRGPRWAFAGGGARRGQVEAFAAAHPEARVELLPYAGGGAHHERLLAGDVHLASLSAPWQGVIVPSKLQAAFSLARPLVFVGPADNEIADWLRESGGGWIAPEGDADALAGAIAAAADPRERARRGAAALAYARRHFDRARNVARLCELFEAAATPDHS